jgi:hypothetical protein
MTRFARGDEPGIAPARRASMSQLLRLARSAALVAASFALVHCGGAVTNPNTISPTPGDGGSGSGSGTASGSGSGSTPGSVLGDCGPSNECPSGSSCYYPIGSCSAKPECVVDPAPGTPECKSVEELCGCDGNPVETGCAFPSGFASGATNGEGSCLISPPVDVDAGGPTPVFPPSDAGEPVEAGTDLGPCTADGCPSGSACFFPIGDCSSTGRCISLSTGPECGAVEELCGCGGGPTVTAGCGYPSGYASGPSNGESNCDTIGLDAGEQQLPDAGH